MLKACCIKRWASSCLLSSSSAGSTFPQELHFKPGEIEVSGTIPLQCLSLHLNPVRFIILDICMCENNNASGQTGAKSVAH